MVRGYRVGGSLLGDLGVIAGGDPSISGRSYGGDPLAVFRMWASALEAQGVNAISGDLYLANGFFDHQRIHPDWPRDQLDRWYEAPVDALSFSDNCLLVRVLPGPAPGRPARVELVPDVSILKIRSTADTTSSSRRHTVSVFRAPDSDEILVSGHVYLRARPVEAWVTVPDPQRYFGAALRKALADEGVALDGEILPVENLPAGRWRPLTVYRSDLLSTIEVINHHSQNFYAESLLKLLGAEICTEGSWAGGLEVVADFLEKVGIPASSYRMADGSGMSRNNLFTPRQLTRLLVHMYHHPLSAEFLESLPPSGSDNGRWDERLAKPPYEGNVWAKTGTLRAVSALSGYARALSGRMYAFSILQNNSPSAWDARRTQDRIIEALIDHG
jgi:D-alanyl-D-alanine carboxypeptidase/D-alanyl-D-alanine-endopeptidase (penicillin-binding protein 4)